MDLKYTIESTDALSSKSHRCLYSLKAMIWKGSRQTLDLVSCVSTFSKLGVKENDLE